MLIKHLETLTSTEVKSFLDSFDDVLCDCDGVLWAMGNTFPDIDKTLKRLRECGKRVRFVSNNSIYGHELLRDKIKKVCPEVEVDDIANPTMAILAYLKQINYDKGLFIIGTPKMKEEFTNAGFNLINTGPNIVSESFVELETNAHQNNEDIGAVIVDMETNLNYMKMSKALICLQNSEVLFILAATDRLLPTGINKALLGPGQFQDILIECTGRVPIVFSKPSREFNEFIIQKFKIKNPSRTLFVGDSLAQDMKFAGEWGYQKLFVATGASTMREIEECTIQGYIPDFYIERFGDLHKLL